MATRRRNPYAHPSGLFTASVREALVGVKTALVEIATATPSSEAEAKAWANAYDALTAAQQELHTAMKALR